MNRRDRFPKTRRYDEERARGRTPRYYSAVNELADAFAELIVNMVIAGSWHPDIFTDFLCALKTRHQLFDHGLLNFDDAIMEILEREEAKP
jgi:hypothetical protein